MTELRDTFQERGRDPELEGNYLRAREDLAGHRGETFSRSTARTEMPSDQNAARKMTHEINAALPPEVRARRRALDVLSGDLAIQNGIASIGFDEFQRGTRQTFNTAIDRVNADAQSRGTNIQALANSYDINLGPDVQARLGHEQAGSAPAARAQSIPAPQR